MNQKVPSKNLAFTLLFYAKKKKQYQNQLLTFLPTTLPPGEEQSTDQLVGQIYPLKCALHTRKQFFLFPKGSNLLKTKVRKKQISTAIGMGSISY